MSKHLSLTLMLIFSLGSTLVVADECFAQGADYRVTIRNDWNRTVRFKRVAAAVQEHASADLQPGGSQTFTLRLTSDQVFVAFDGNKIIGMSDDLRLNRNLTGIVLTVTQNGSLSVAASSN